MAKKCGDCLYFRFCRKYVDPEETFPEIGGCHSFTDKADLVGVVRCKDCKHFKPAHFKADDGTETPWDETFNWDDRSDGIYHGGKCKHDRNTAYGQKDMAFRKPDDFCSYGERREGE